MQIFTTKVDAVGFGGKVYIKIDGKSVAVGGSGGMKPTTGDEVHYVVHAGKEPRYEIIGFGPSVEREIVRT